ncbi:aurora kinase A- and ninein-interacting protein [Gastrophryne carolinensis]
MKSKKKHGRLLQPEECGVWLDTAELKKRPQQTRIPCTYSNRFNPLLRRPNSESAVLDFTQTKSPQLCTKQTSINTFFTTKSKTKLQPTNKENLYRSPCKKSKSVEDVNTIPLSIRSSSCLVPSDGVNDHTVCQCAHTCDFNRSTQEHLQLGENASDTYKSVTNDVCNWESLSGNEESSNSSINFILTSKNNLEVTLDSPALSSYTERHKVRDVESLWDSQLFTQDSQGNRVIAHRSTCTQQELCSAPLHDRTNAAWYATSPLKKGSQYLCNEDSLQNMFTQDTEGNVVIKH